MKRALALVLACLGAFALAACSRSTIQSGNARLSFDRARVQLASGGAPFRAVDDGATLRTGDRVRVVAGEAEMQLPGQARLLVRKGTEVLVGKEPTLTAGDAVALAVDEPLTVRALGSSVTARDGATRIRGGLALTAGVYGGSAYVESAGRSLVVPALRQAAVASFGVVPAAPSALEYLDTDQWDLRYLGVAVEIGKELQARSDGFSTQVRPGEGRTPGFYATLLPDLPARALVGCPSALDGSLGDGRRPGEVLVGTTLALQGRLASFTSRCKEAFAFRDDGATWGLVALDQRLRSLPAIRDRLESAIGRLPSDATIAAMTSPVAQPVLDGLDGAIVEAVPVSPSRPTGSPTPAPVPTPTPTPSPVIPAPVPDVPGLPPVTPLLPPIPDPTGGVLTPVTDLVGNLLGGLLGG